MVLDQPSPCDYGDWLNIDKAIPVRKNCFNSIPLNEGNPVLSEGNMTPQQQRITIAEACGWKRWKWGMDVPVGLVLSDGKFDGYKRRVEKVYKNGVTLDVDESPLYRWDKLKAEFNPSSHWVRPNGKILKYPPDYLSDLNAMHEAEKTLTHEQQDQFIQELYRGLIAPAEAEYGTIPLGSRIWIYLHATAAQRAEAFLRVKGLWK